MSTAIASRNGLKETTEKTLAQLPTRIRVYVTCEGPHDSASHIVKGVLLKYHKFLFGGENHPVNFLSDSFQHIKLPCVALIVAASESLEETKWKKLFRLFAKKANLPTKIEIPTHIVRPDDANILAACMSNGCEDHLLGLKSDIAALLLKLERFKLNDRDDVIYIHPPRQPLPGPFALEPLE